MTSIFPPLRHGTCRTTVTYDPFLGHNIKSVIAEALHIANDTDSVVLFTFNGMNFSVTREHSFKDVLRDWDRRA